MKQSTHVSRTAGFGAQFSLSFPTFNLSGDTLSEAVELRQWFLGSHCHQFNFLGDVLWGFFSSHDGIKSTRRSGLPCLTHFLRLHHQFSWKTRCSVCLSILSCAISWVIFIVDHHCDIAFASCGWKSICGRQSRVWQGSKKKCKLRIYEFSSDTLHYQNIAYNNVYAMVVLVSGCGIVGQSYGLMCNSCCHAL